MRFERIRREDLATAYTVGVERIDPEESPALKPAGYHSENTLFVVMTGSETIASHDRFKISRQLPGDASWVVDELARLEDEIREGDR